MRPLVWPGARDASAALMSALELPPGAVSHWPPSLAVGPWLALRARRAKSSPLRSRSRIAWARAFASARLAHLAISTSISRQTTCAGRRYFSRFAL